MCADFFLVCVCVATLCHLMSLKHTQAHEKVLHGESSRTISSQTTQRILHDKQQGATGSCWTDHRLSSLLGPLALQSHLSDSWPAAGKWQLEGRKVDLVVWQRCGGWFNQDWASGSSSYMSMAKIQVKLLELIALPAFVWTSSAVQPLENER